ncbi:MAG: hypothetical protein IKR37_01045 [Paludibacteraceae bacterium]|nr:hypothetical protein [Paludibacteraceae bacterium]
MTSIGRIIWSSVGIAIMTGLMIAAVVWGYMSRPTDNPCAGVEYAIEDRAERLYLTENELSSLLEKQDLYPVGRKLSAVALHRIENAILRHPMVRTAECYLTPKHIVRIRLTQRVPLLRVQTPLDTYLIDSDRKVMQARSSVRDEVPLVTGNVGVQMASGPMADFAEWLQKESYWQERIRHLYVQNPVMVYIYMRNPNQPRVVMGSMRDYERKLKKLRTFYQNIPAEVKEKNYTELDVRFRGQVIGRY